MSTPTSECLAGGCPSGSATAPDPKTIQGGVTAGQVGEGALAFGASTETGQNTGMMGGFPPRR
ncbi:MAG: hypothetical protein OXG44_11900 [Gammaproteobacteria bacterium]|nr:hypothetical protein [Gammaproteobacteria bacterium]